MITCKDFLNKIKWSKKFNTKEIKIYYLDRIKKELIERDFEDISIEGDYIIVDENEIPIHRIKEIRKKGMIIWKR